MNYFRSLLVVSFLFIFNACSDSIETEDYRIPFTGNYECVKQPNSIYLPDILVNVEVRIDSASSDKIYVNNDLVPISEDGTYGPDLLRHDYNYELRFKDDSIFIQSYVIIVNGIVAPCKLTGVKI